MVRGVPSVREIQRALVEISDKEADFAGSREWIGCFEACLVLDHLCSVSSHMDTLHAILYTLIYIYVAAHATESCAIVDCFKFTLPTCAYTCITPLYCMHLQL